MMTEQIIKEQINQILRKHLKYREEKQIDILKECLFELEEKKRLEAVEEAVALEVWLKKKEEKRLILEEKRRIHDYKPIRFKKPLPPLEERRQYTRCCNRCGEYYRTFSKYGKFCDGCKKGGINDGVPQEINNLEKAKTKNGNS